MDLECAEVHCKLALKTDAGLSFTTEPTLLRTHVV